ncbi:hypothetical protein YC2023_011693 [Brassica napus]
MAHLKKVPSIKSRCIVSSWRRFLMVQNMSYLRMKPATLIFIDDIITRKQ